ncbi:MAG: hypothetical protein LAO76_17490 [Acidobacteriia bacterium]|nr:hypothetical protein [Terriglobia bacterium]
MNAPEMSATPLAVNETDATWRRLFLRTYEIYWEQFAIFFRMALVPAVVAYGFTLFWRIATRWVLHQLPSRSVQRGLVGILNGWGSGAGYWIISAFFFAAVAAHVLAPKSLHESAISDAYSVAKSRLGELVTIALLTWTLFWFLRGLAAFAILWPLLGRISSRYNWLLELLLGLLLVVIGGLLSRLGLVIPELVLHPDTQLKTAIKNSLRKSEGWERFFILLLAKSAVIAYCAYWLLGIGMDFLWERSRVAPDVYSWLEWVLYIVTAAVLEPPLFIAFSLLHREIESSTNQTESVEASAEGCNTSFSPR